MKVFFVISFILCSSATGHAQSSWGSYSYEGPWIDPSFSWVRSASEDEVEHLKHNFNRKPDELTVDERRRIQAMGHELDRLQDGRLTDSVRHDAAGRLIGDISRNMCNHGNFGNIFSDDNRRLWCSLSAFAIASVLGALKENPYDKNTGGYVQASDALSTGIAGAVIEIHH